MVQEWIGLKVKIISSTNPNNIGLEGEIVDETLNTICVLTKKNERKTVAKKGARAKIISSGSMLELGDAIMRPQDRSKRLYKKIIDG